MIWLLETLMMNSRFPIAVDMLLKDKDSIALRVAPSAPAESVYIGENRNAQIQILVKSTDQKQAMQRLEELVELYKDLQRKPHLTYNNKYKITSANVYTEPSFVSMTEERFYVYTAILQFEMERMI